jgi:hypothetical protein
VAKERKDRIGLLVIRAFVEEDRRRRLLVELLEVNPPSADRVIGIVDSSAAASRLVGAWLDSLEINAAAGIAPPPSVEGDP